MREINRDPATCTHPTEGVIPRYRFTNETGDPGPPVRDGWRCIDCGTNDPEMLVPIEPEML